jgi:2-polyprenyl-3-methyl-5-hydroxy-6-metoxy-1,4-benzoquinol methylase
MLNKESSMLDIGCGPGLYTMRLSELGYRVSGLDFSERSIEYAKSHDSKPKYVLMNYVEMDYLVLFDLITLF